MPPKYRSTEKGEEVRSAIKRFGSKQEEIEYMMSYLAAERAPDGKNMDEWRKKYEEPATYNVLSQPVRHELNKFFFDVTPNPSRAQRRQLWYDLHLLDTTVPMKKIVKWFQNKRQYMKKQYGQEISSADSADECNESSAASAIASASSSRRRFSTSQMFYRKGESSPRKSSSNSNSNSESESESD